MLPATCFGGGFDIPYYWWPNDDLLDVINGGPVTTPVLTLLLVWASVRVVRRRWREARAGVT